MKIMIVDDNEQNLYLLEVLLRSEKYEVVCARDGLEALEHLKKGSFGLIISDILMPRMDGFQLCRECKVDPLLKYIPFIFYTATYTDQKDEEFALSLGADRFIAKPIEPQIFLTTIREVIKEYEKGALTAKESLIKDEELYLAEYNKRLIQKLEKKMLDLKVAHKALAESEQKYRSIFENAVEGIFQTTPDGRYISINPALARMYGYESQEEIFKTITRIQEEQYVNPEDLVRLKKLYEEKGYVRAFEVELYKKDRGRIWVSINGRAVRDEVGKILYYEGIVEDITDHKRAEEVLRSEREKLEMVTQNMGAGLAFISKDYQTLWANNVLKQIFGDVEGKTCYSTYNQRTEVCPQCGVREVFEKGSEKVVHEQVGKDIEGNTIWSEIIATPVKDKNGNITAALELVIPITERKRAEEALFESEQRYRNLVEDAPDVIFTLAPDGTFASLNPAFETITGWPRSEWLQRQFISILHPDDLSAGLEFFQRILKGENLPPFQLRVLKKSGDYLVAEFTVTPQTQNGSVLNILGIARDITERKRAEEALQRAEEKYRTILETMAEGYYEVDLAGNFTFFNEQLCRMLGYTGAEVTGMNNRKYMDGETAKKVFQIFNKIFAEDGPPETFEWKITKKDGTIRYHESSVSIIKNAKGKKVGFKGIARDITERKRADENLKQSEENARGLAQENAVMAEIGRIISSTLNTDEVYESFSKEVKKIIPFDRIVINIIDTEKRTINNVYIAGAAVGDRHVKDIYPVKGSGIAEMVRTKSTFLIQTEDFSEYKERFPMLLSTFQAGFRSIMNVPLFSKGKIIGGLLLRSLKAYAYTDRDIRLAERVASQIGGAIANAQLYTERIQAEKERAALEEQLRQSQKMEAIGRLSGGIAHDFNNLLTVIKGYSQLSLIELKENDPMRGGIEEIKRAADRAADLTRQLLAFSRRQILEMSVLDLNTVLRDLDKMLRRVIGEDIELATLLAEDLGRVKTDPGQVQQVIMNLAVNAKDAMPNGGKLTIETANMELDETYARSHVAVKPGRYVMLSVSDTGVGMTAEVREQIFEPFFTTKEKGKGTGLGLSTVYGIVKQSGGNIWVYSEPGQGTTFKIYLPRVDEPLEELKEKVEVKEIPRGSETILVVEDEDEVRKVAVRILSGQGYKVLEASHGNDAILVCKQHEGPIHLMVTDVVMPNMSGHELAERLVSLQPGMRVLYMSGYTDNAIVHRGILGKGMNYIQKPFTIEGLARKVREVLDK